MHRRFSTLISPSKLRNEGSSGSAFSETESQLSAAGTVVHEHTINAAPTLKVKRVDYYYSWWARNWTYRDMNAKVTVETRKPGLVRSGENDPWKEFCFVVIRTVPRDDMLAKPTFKIQIKSPYLLQACKDVIVSWPGISWNADPLQLEPETFLTFLPNFITYRDTLFAKKPKSDEESNIAATVNVLIDFLEKDYRETLSNIARLTSHGEITFEYLYAILVPRSILVAQCSITGDIRAFKLNRATKIETETGPVYQLICDSVDHVDLPITGAVSVGRVQTYISLPFFKGTVPISTLDAYPIKYHANERDLSAKLMERGRKWLAMSDIHHKEYHGIGALKTGRGLTRHNVNGRVMVDRAAFKKQNPNYPFGIAVATTLNEEPARDAQNGQYQMYPDDRRHSGEFVQPFLPPGSVPLMMPAQMGMGGVYAPVDAIKTSKKQEIPELSDQDLILTPTVVYGFSLTDKVWLEFSVHSIHDVDWNDEAFANLVLPNNRKFLLQSLIEAHHQGLGFDDFVKGKGHGLVINLFGAPGTGKTFSAEATSEHVRRPLYVVGAGDLGTKPSELDAALEQVFAVATSWKAIVLIDEADVFMEQRSLHDLQRNAAVAVFLRHVEYYQGILFLTTNRIKTFDDAFLSRIHVALHFLELDQTSRSQVWTAFLAKVDNGHVQLSDAELENLASRPINGRQIKNAVRTASSLALGRKEVLGMKHFVETLEAMNEFTKDFEAIRIMGAAK